MPKQLDKSWRGRTVSNATLRPQDLIPVFLTTLKPQMSKSEWDKLVDEAPDEMKNSGRTGFEIPDDDSDLWNTSDIDWFHDVLFDKMDEIAPEGTHFGSHEGDGACFGFWSDYLIPADVLREDELKRLNEMASYQTFDYASRMLVRELYWKLVNEYRDARTEGSFLRLTHIEALRIQLGMGFNDDLQGQ